jgi:hypothetical protein
MHLRHEEVLADIERRVRAVGASLEDIDCCNADELGVPADYSFTYLLVWGAIEAYREARDFTHPGWLGIGQEAGEPRLEQAQQLANSIDWHASTICQDTAALDDHGQVVATTPPRSWALSLSCGRTSAS